MKSAVRVRSSYTDRIVNQSFLLFRLEHNGIALLVNPLRALVFLLLTALSAIGSAQSVFYGEDVLAFANRTQESATSASVDEAIKRVFERLELPPAARGRYGNAASLNLQKEKRGFEARRLDSVILTAAGKIKLGFAVNAIVIAEGDVEVDVAAGILVIAGGSIKVRRETSQGIYISKSSVSIEGGMGPFVYAVRGATVKSEEPFTAYNTDTANAGGALSYRYSRPALFQGEPVRAPAGPAMVVSGGESMSFSGNRCSTAIADTVDLHSQMLPYARKRADCPEIDSAAVRCVQEEDPQARQPASQELWTLQLCGRPMTLLAQSKRIAGKGSKAGSDSYDHSIKVQSGARLPRADHRSASNQRTRFAADDALALAARIKPAATREQTVLAVRRVLEALDLPQELRSKYAYMGSANFRAEKNYFETSELTETVILVNGSTRIGFARNAIIIARGDVRVAHGAGLIIVSDGSIRLSHETGLLGVAHAPGVYIARETVDISHSLHPVIYAPKGTTLPPYRQMTAINTDISSVAGSPVTRYTVAALFAGEPTRAPVPRPAPPSAPFAYGGSRCANAMPDEIALLQRMRAIVAREAGCQEIHSVTASCTQESTARNGFTSVERWTFDMCGRSLNLVSQISGYVPLADRTEPSAMAVHASLKIERPPRPAEDVAEEERWRMRFASMTPEEKARMTKLNEEAIAHHLKGDLFEAREKYHEANRISGTTARTGSNLHSVERQLERSDAATEVLTAKIDGGKADAITYAERGLIRIRFNDMSRGLRDLDHASAISRNNPRVDTERAWGLLIANRPELAEAAAIAVLAKEPTHHRALEVLAWSRLFQNRPREAFQDADRSLRVDPPWTAETFAAERAGYRAIAGYLALSNAESRASAVEWLLRWKPYLRTGAWPDAFALFLLGEINEEQMKAVAVSMQPTDRGAAAGEGFAFLAHDGLSADERKQRADAMRQYFRTSFGAGHSLAYAAYVRATLRK